MVLSLIAAVLGLLLGGVCCTILNRIPSKWLCDYDEEPSEELKTNDRFSFINGAIMGVALAVIFSGELIINGITAEAFIACTIFLVLVMISSADAKYMIIPDQFTIAVAVLASVFAGADLLTSRSFISAWYSPLVGAAAGSSALILLDIFSMVVLKAEGFGFGDIKLVFVLGLMLGWKKILLMIVLSSFIAVIHFLALTFTKNKGKRQMLMPMGPYLCISTSAIIIFHTQIESFISIYKDLLGSSVLP